jgi:hypothetical protein
VGGTTLPIGSLVDKDEIREANALAEAEGKPACKTKKPRPATAKTLLLGITKASLQAESFLSGASFQETTKVLTEAALGDVPRAIAAHERVVARGPDADSLDALVPQYLSAVPRDPYTDKEAFHSKPVEGGMLVWWVGSDGADDGGPTARDSWSEDVATGNDDLGLWLVPDRPEATPAAPVATE